jgi:hypothetical protein
MARGNNDAVVDAFRDDAHPDETPFRSPDVPVPVLDDAVQSLVLVHQ